MLTQAPVKSKGQINKVVEVNRGMAYVGRGSVS